MASKFKIGDLVWAKMKGFPAWPGKVIQPKPEVKRPANKKTQQFIFFFGSENYAWIPEDTMWEFRQHKERFNISSRVPRGFKEAVEAIEDAYKTKPEDIAAEDLPTIDDELKQIFPSGHAHKEKTRHKTKEREPNKKATTKRGASPTPSPATAMSKKSRILERSSKMAASSPSSGSAAAVHSPGSTVFNSTNGSSANVKVASSPEHDGPVSPPPSRSPEETAAILQTPLATELSGMIATPMKIGFVGLGIMGQGMVSQLLKSSHEVTVWNRTGIKCREFVKEGALKANSPADVVSQCDITFSCVSDPAALKDIVFGNSGILQGIRPGKSYVDMSTVDVDTITDISEAVTARGGRFLEAPVVGSRNPAATGDLVILASGDITLYEDCATCFKAMSKKSFYLGDTGNGIRMKLVVNMLMGTVLAGLAESMALAEKVGLDQAELLEVLSLSAIASPMVDSKGTAMLMSNFEPHGLLKNVQKDLRLTVNMADTVDQPLHVVAAANELFKKAKAKGYGEHDSAAVYRAADM